MVTFKLDGSAALTNQEKAALAKARSLPIVCDEDSPPMSDEMERAFRAARKAKPYRGDPTLYDEYGAVP